MSDDKVVEFTKLPIRRMVEKEQCHHDYSFDLYYNSRRIECRRCKTSLDPFWVLMRLTCRQQRTEEELSMIREHRQKEIDKLKERAEQRDARRRNKMRHVENT